MAVISRRQVGNHRTLTSVGGTHVSVLTNKVGLDTAAAHLYHASSVKDALDAGIGGRS